MKPQKKDDKDDLNDQLVDLDAFPINQPESSSYFALLEQARASLGLDGCVRFGQFIKAEYQSMLLAETEELEPLALFSSKEFARRVLRENEKQRELHRRRRSAVDRDADLPWRTDP